MRADKTAKKSVQAVQKQAPEQKTDDSNAFAVSASVSLSELKPLVLKHGNAFGVSSTRAVAIRGVFGNNTTGFYLNDTPVPMSLDPRVVDIDRIEVIRGPGATLWGANAVNGVINIISKKAKDTQSGVVTAGAGTEERGSGGVRYGSKIGDTSYRAYGKYFNWGPIVIPKAELTRRFHVWAQRHGQPNERRG